MSCSHLFVGVDLPEVNMRHRVPKYQGTVQAARQELLPAHTHLSFMAPSCLKSLPRIKGYFPLEERFFLARKENVRQIRGFQPENKVSEIKIPAMVSH
jgi:hypothetical protein